jgi:hypothetical protein
METSNLDAAIRTLLDAGDHHSVEKIEVEDGGKKVTIPVVVMDSDEGGQKVHSLLDIVKQGAELARAERLRDAPGPDKREGTAQMQALDSFVAHLNRFKDEDSVVWADAAGCNLVAVLDYHAKGSEGAARWGRHRGIYACPLSEAWRAWGGGAPMKLDQETFALLLDARDRDLISGTVNGKAAPDPSALVTLAGTLESYSTSKAKRERDPNTGRVKVSFSNESGFMGDVAPPPSFLISIPVFQDGAPQSLEVRLRVEVENGAATFIAQIHAANDVLRDAFRALCERVKTETDLPVFVGKPE